MITNKNKEGEKMTHHNDTRRLKNEVKRSEMKRSEVTRSEVKVSEVK